MKFTLTLPLKDIQAAYQDALKAAAKDVAVKGFRKGTAPLDLVEAQLDKSKLYEKAMMKVFVPTYNKYVDEHKLKPITMPRVNLKSANEKEDWELEVEIAQKPAVDLNNYESEVKGLKAKSAIWTPDKAAKDDGHNHSDQEKLNEILELLLKTCQLEVPELLVEEETNRALSRLVEQVEKLGLNIEQYASSLGKTVESLRQEYTNTSQKNVKLDFIIEAIAEKQGLIASDTELNKFIEKIDDPRTKQEVSQSAYAKASFRDMLTRQKVVDHLQSL
jgi:FKBP-type peptidyl-prolyl cis-trans isomerase (trigger factor)